MRDILYLAWRYLACHRVLTSILVFALTLIIFLPVGLRVLVRQSEAELTTRATPIVFDGRACVSGRYGQDLLMQEIVACFDAGTGEKLWERRFPVYNTTVPFTRVGWASLGGDPETGYVYAQNVDGHFLAFDREGEIVWERRLGEQPGVERRHAHVRRLGGVQHAVDHDSVTGTRAQKTERANRSA